MNSSLRPRDAFPYRIVMQNLHRAPTWTCRSCHSTYVTAFPGGGWTIDYDALYSQFDNRIYNVIENWNLHDDFGDAIERLLATPELFRWVDFYDEDIVCPYCTSPLLADRDREFKEGNAYFIEYLPWRAMEPIPVGTRFKKFIRDGEIVLLPDLPAYTKGLKPVEKQSSSE